MIRKMLKNRFLTNTSWIIGQQIIHLLLSLVVNVLSARYLGPSNFGLINYVASFVAMFSSIATLGMDGVVIKKMVETPNKEGEILGSCIVYRAIAGLFSAISVIFLVAFTNIGDKEIIWVAILYSLSLIFRCFELLDCWFQKMLQSKYTSIAKTLSYIVVCAYKIFLLATGQNVVWFALANSLDYFLIAIVLIFFYLRKKNQCLSVKMYTGFDVLKSSYHFVISGLMVALYNQMDKIMLKSIVDSEAVGLYSTASSICAMWIFVPTAIINSARPIIMEAKKRSEEEYLLKLKQLYSAIIWICITASGMISILGEFIIHILYGAAYAGAVNALRVLIWCETFSMIGTARGIWIISENKNKYVKYYLACGVVVNLILNYLLIPIIGITGASVATLITQIVTSMIAPVLFKGTRIHTKYVLQSFALTWLWGNKRKKHN